MKAILLALLTGILATMGVPKSVRLPDSHPSMVRYDACAADVVEVVSSMVPPERVGVIAPIAYVFALKEGNCQANPKGDNDKGAACGVMQTHTPDLILPGATCEKVRADRKLGIRVGVTLMLAKEAECGSMRAGLTAYATNGACPAKGWTINLVLERCKLAGGVC
jgi:hypothetical protein